MMDYLTLFQSDMQVGALTFAPLIEGWLLWFFLGLSAALFIALCFLAPARGRVLRLLTLVLLVAVILNPAIKQSDRQPEKMRVLAFIDQSYSQDLAPRPAQIEQLKNWLSNEVQSLSNHDIELIPIAQNNEQESQRSDLLSAVIQRLEDENLSTLSGVFLVTDGQIHDLDKKQRLQTALGARPFHILVTGEENEKDLRLRLTQAPPYGIVGDRVQIKLQVNIDGDLDVPEDQRYLRLRYGSDERETTFTPNEEITISLPIEHAGQNVIMVEAPILDGEISTANNSLGVVVKGVRDRLKVLLVSGKPHAGGRMWRNLLKSDPSVDLVHFTILRDPTKQDPTSPDELSLIAFPVRELFEVKIDEFDLIIFDRYDQTRILPPAYYQNILNFVNQGGAYLEASGPSFLGPNSTYRTPLQRMIPSAPQGGEKIGAFIPQISDIGRWHPVTRPLAQRQLDGEVWASWFRQLDIAKREGKTLMTGLDEEPLLILHEYGKGRVAQLTSDHIWLWERTAAESGPFYPLLRRIIHWLMKEPELDADTLRIEQFGKQVRLSLPRSTDGQSSIEVHIDGPEGMSQTLTLYASEGDQALLTGRFDAQRPGIYQFSYAGQELYRVIGDINAPELQSMRSNLEGMEKLADDLNSSARAAERALKQPLALTGSNSRFTSSHRFLLPDHAAYRIIGSKTTPLLPPFGWLLLSLLAFTLLWWREGRVKQYKDFNHR